MKGSFVFLVASLAGSVVASPSWRSLLGVEKRQAGRCGTGFGGVCGTNECCSSAGWCGTGYLYCSAPSCQIEYGPGCDANVRPTGPDTIDIARPKVGSIPYGQAIYRCSHNGDIALTYDDGPYTYTEDLLDLLKQYNARATFYITGRNLGKGAINDPATPWPGLIRRMIKDGHQIASHTWSHQRLTTLSRAKFWNQMIFNEVAFSDILGYFPTYMRPPYSASNATTDAWLGELGYHVTYFNLDTEGYLHDSPNTISTSKQIWDSTVEGRSPSSNTWLHIEHDPVYQSVYNLTEYMLKSLNRNQFSAVTVGECLQDPKANWYRQRPVVVVVGRQLGHQLGHLPRHDQRPVRLRTRRRHVQGRAKRRDVLLAEGMVRLYGRSLREGLPAGLRDLQWHVGAGTSGADE
ncbi:hypothetical protein ACHAQI_001729 [Fusarium lateritium]